MTARKVPGDPFAAGRGSSLLGGLDGKVGVTHDLTMNFTVNPDFGQVEADPSVVNLTAFETYYQEKRPFFIEGRNIFSFRLMSGDGDQSGDSLFYSRRVGRVPQIPPGRGRPCRYARGDDHSRGVQADREDPKRAVHRRPRKRHVARRRRPSSPPAGSATRPSSR